MSEPKYKVGEHVKWDGVPKGPKPNDGYITDIQQQSHPTVQAAFPGSSEWYYQMSNEGHPWIQEDLISDVGPIPEPSVGGTPPTEPKETK